MHIVAYQPDIPQNVGSFIRLCACMDTPLHIVEPCGFLFDDKRIRRVAMDYYDAARITRHRSWEAFLEYRRLDLGQETPVGRLLLLSTHASEDYTRFAYAPNDMLVLGRESAGVPPEVAQAADARLRIEMNAGTRSLNVALAASMVLGEAIRQTKGMI
jgi:tRNA (cytidine/uridine-2'-O-)-methyltransferase